MRGQIWPSVLIMIGGVVVGVLVAFAAIFPTVNASSKLVKTSPDLSIVEINVEQSSLEPFTVTLYSYDNGIVVDAKPEKGAIVEGLKRMGLEVNE